MKLLIFLAIFVVFMAAADDTKFPTFAEWKKLYNKIYETKALETQAETTYKANCARMTIDNTKLTYKQKPNENSDLTPEQLKAAQGSVTKDEQGNPGNFSKSNTKSTQDKNVKSSGEKNVKASIPATLDYRS